MPTLDANMIGTVLLGLAQLAALARGYYGLKADNERLAARLEIAMLTERADRLSSINAARAELATAISKVETTFLDVTHRISTLEAGQDEWTKALRSRTHELANDLHSLVLRVDRLERPKGQQHDH